MDHPNNVLITTRSEFQSALRLGFARALAAGSPELWLSDDDFADWPLGERELVAQLGGWAAPNRRLTLIARSFDELARRHPRWVAWRADWSHIVSCRVNAELEAPGVPSLFIALDTCTVKLSDRAHCRGRLSYDKADEIRCKELFDAVSQRSQEAFPATVTGL